MQLLIAVTIPLVTAIWYIADIKAQIYKYVDNSLQARDIRLNQLEKDLAIHLTSYEERTEFVDYQLHGLDEKINHKFQRLIDEIKKSK